MECLNKDCLRKKRRRKRRKIAKSRLQPQFWTNQRKFPGWLVPV
jgi:hypothetical protein